VIGDRRRDGFTEGRHQPAADAVRVAAGASTHVIVPTYNEADNIEELTRQLLALPVALNVIIVDDNSPDGTGDLADQLALASDGRIRVIHRPGKMGLGTAYIAGMKLALTDPEAQRVITMDADFSHDPRYIPQMVELARTSDVIIGSRYVAGGGTSGCKLRRVWLSRIANSLARTVLGLAAHDCTAGFRLYQRHVLESIPLDRIFSSGYSFLVEMLYLSQQETHRFAELPIVFEDRRKGKTKISSKEILRAQYTVARLGFRRLFGRPVVQAVSRISTNDRG
jgi:dolichol-phosphate mannosyltransferase